MEAVAAVPDEIDHGLKIPFEVLVLLIALLILVIIFIIWRILAHRKARAAGISGSGDAHRAGQDRTAGGEDIEEEGAESNEIQQMDTGCRLCRRGISRGGHAGDAGIGGRGKRLDHHIFARVLRDRRRTSPCPGRK